MHAPMLSLNKKVGFDIGYGTKLFIIIASNRLKRDSLNSDPLFLFNRMIEKGQLSVRKTVLHFLNAAKQNFDFLKFCFFK